MAKLIQFKDNNEDNLYSKQFYPVGWILISYCNINPTTFCIGTWQLTGQGRTLVGVDVAQAEFNTVGKIGGSKYIQDHVHQTYIAGGGNQARDTAGYSWDGGTARPYVNTTSPNVTVGTSGNLQPYITCYIWQRVA